MAQETYEATVQANWRLAKNGFARDLRPLGRQPRLDGRVSRASWDSAYQENYSVGCHYFHPCMFSICYFCTRVLQTRPSAVNLQRGLLRRVRHAIMAWWRDSVRCLPCLSHKRSLSRGADRLIGLGSPKQSNFYEGTNRRPLLLFAVGNKKSVAPKPSNRQTSAISPVNTPTAPSWDTRCHKDIGNMVVGMTGVSSTSMSSCPRFEAVFTIPCT